MKPLDQVAALERWLRAEEGNEIAIRIVRLGTPRRDYFDQWLPDLAPSASLVAQAKSLPLTPAQWQVFARRYRSEMAKPPARRLLATLAALSSQANFSVGCYCVDETRCHRSVLRQLLIEAGATVL